MPRKSTHGSADSDVVKQLDREQYQRLIDLMDELAFRGPKQEALIMRIATCGEFEEVIKTIKRRRLYSKRMDDGEDVGAHDSGTPGPARGKRKGNKSPRGRKRATPPVNHSDASTLNG